MFSERKYQSSELNCMTQWTIVALVLYLPSQGGDLQDFKVQIESDTLKKIPIFV